MRSSPATRLLASVLVLACSALAVACSDDDDSGGGAEPAASSTSTTAAPATSTTKAAVPLAIVIGGQGMLGWWDGGQWVQAKEGESTPFTPGETYTLVELDGSSSSARATALRDQEEFCGTPQVDFSPSFPEPTTGGVDDLDPIAVHGVGDVQPRRATLLDTGTAVYRDAAREVLAGLGIHDDEPELAQVVRADLSGDGTDEVLVVAERLADPATAQGEPGDYSVLFLRQVVDGEVRTTVLDHFYKEPAEEPSIYILVHRISGIVDLNGDGVLEVVTEEQYYEGSSTAVRALQPDGTLTEVIVAGCGV